MLFAPRYAPLVFSLMMSIYMVTLMTFVITWANTGMGEGFLGRWWHAFYIAWPVAFTLILLGAPRVQRLVGHLIKKPLGA
ncbi:DUF2798 domain-containing protein [Halomonas dongshanensis]|uniref:DUF2798 domain-containing protein n=1 Tax=Halomonas dongshanensis TaxID=2890835 RepID=A0ABT2EEL5_9GAMM|nr:DUF2798 domain-containing protein [Halomonas dongshanensis]MCS2609798.1 DUF2798 domain-containing protein [Halomonas dongshanensis]